MTPTQHRQRATKRAGRAPVVFGRRLAPTKPIDSELRAWRRRSGEMLVRVAEWEGCEWTAEVMFRTTRVLDVFGSQVGVTRELEKFLKALKRAAEGVP